MSKYEELKAKFNFITPFARKHSVLAALAAGIAAMAGLILLAFGCVEDLPADVAKELKALFDRIPEWPRKLLTPAKLFTAGLGSFSISGGIIMEVIKGLIDKTAKVETTDNGPSSDWQQAAAAYAALYYQYLFNYLNQLFWRRIFYRCILLCGVFAVVSVTCAFVYPLEATAGSDGWDGLRDFCKKLGIDSRKGHGYVGMIGYLLMGVLIGVRFSAPKYWMVEWPAQQVTRTDSPVNLKYPVEEVSFLVAITALLANFCYLVTNAGYYRFVADWDNKTLTNSPADLAWVIGFRLLVLPLCAYLGTYAMLHIRKRARVAVAADKIVYYLEADT